MDARILVISDELVRTGFGELFHCLEKIERVRHTGIASAIETYEEAFENGWDVVIIVCNDSKVIERLVTAIWNSADEQQILVIDEHFNYPADMFTLVCVPPVAEMVRQGLEQLGFGGDA